jgi:hypothetical protein
VPEIAIEELDTVVIWGVAFRHAVAGGDAPSRWRAIRSNCLISLSEDNAMPKNTRLYSIHLQAIPQRAWLATVLTAGSLVYLVGCQTLSGPKQPLSASLRTDSAQIGVRHSSFAYMAEIGFVYTNTTAKPVSKAGCGFPPFPELEKKVNDRWVAAYYPIYLLCLTKPDFMLRSGETYHGVLNFTAYERGHNTAPTLEVDSIDGTYRLRWDFAEGTDATVEGTRSVEAVSNEFRMVLSER